MASPSAPVDREYGRLFLRANLMNSGSWEDARNGFGCMCNITGLCPFFVYSLKGKMWDFIIILSGASASVGNLLVAQIPQIPCACPV